MGTASGSMSLALGITQLYDADRRTHVEKKRSAGFIRLPHEMTRVSVFYNVEMASHLGHDNAIFPAE